MPNDNNIDKKVNKRVSDEAKKQDKKPDKTLVELTEDFIAECLGASERGDGIVYATIQKDKFLFNKLEDKWMAWEGHHWVMDKDGFALQGVEAVALEYDKAGELLEKPIKKAKKQEKENLESYLIKKQQSFYQNATRLRGLKGARACLTWAHHVPNGLSIQGTEFDKNPWLLGCKNGVIDLRTGDKRDGLPEDLILKASPHDYDGIDTKCPTWNQFLRDIFEDDQELIDYVQRLFGYTIAGLTHEHVVPVLYGEGRNGKGTFIETLKYVLGEQAQPIQSEMLLDQRINNAAGGPTSHIMSLKGLRIAIASETDEGRRFSPSKVKLYSGGDTLVGRNPHATYETVFTPTHTLCLITNHLPHAPGDDHGFWERLKIVPFMAKFTDTPSTDEKTHEKKKDKGLPDKLKKEASGILAWAVRGFLDWEAQGFNPPLKVINATQDYKLDEDTIAKFIEERCYPLEETKKTTFTNYAYICQIFEDWYSLTISNKVPKRGWIAKQIERKGPVKDKKNGNAGFYGIDIDVTKLPEGD